MCVRGSGGFLRSPQNASRVEWSKSFVASDVENTAASDGGGGLFDTAQTETAGRSPLSAGCKTELVQDVGRPGWYPWAPRLRGHCGVEQSEGVVG